MERQPVSAVVVTYNRKELLLECLEALKGQTVPLDAIYLIDNASTDATPQRLLEAGFIDIIPTDGVTEPVESHKTLSGVAAIDIYYVRMHRNTGGAGGFHEGVRRAYERGAHWLWLMDDDVEPVKNALEVMLSFTAAGECVLPNKKFSDGTVLGDDSHFSLSMGKMMPVRNGEFAQNCRFSFKNYATFEGMLISRRIVEQIGYPDRRFFYLGDDFVYGLMASLYTNIVFIKDGLFYKKLKRQDAKSLMGRESIRLKDMEIYYRVRNMFLIFEYMKKIGTFSPLAYVSLFMNVIKSAIGIVVYDKSLRRLYLLFKGLIDGVLKKFTKW
ncbi:MAG: glycosyltransferase [Nitrospirae bacterium]|nr:glycosyltransferase [Nitrospirota bacterium]